MAEESQGVTADTTDATAVDATVEQTTEVEAPTTEQSTDEVTDDAATSEETEAAETETAEESDQVEEVPEDLAPKSQNRFQKLANENRELKAKIAQLEEVAVPTEQDYLDGGYDATEAKLNALEARFQQQEAISKIADLNKDIDNDMVRIIHEYPALDPKSPEFNQDLAMNLFQQYDRDAGAKYTDDGITLETNQLPYEYIKSKMDLIGLGTKKAQVQAQKNVENMVRQAETPTSTAPVSSDDDSIEAMRERLASVKF